MPSREAIKTEKAQRRLSEYIRQAWPVIEPETRYLHNWHIDAICEYLEAVSRGEILRLCINMPPRYMKSIIASVMWPTWDWTKTPTSRWVFCSYSGSLSTKHSVDRRTVITSDWYRQRWGDKFYLSGDQNLKTEFQNHLRGVMVATSVGGSATGKGGNKIVFDDPHNPEQAESEVEREAAIRFLDRTLSTRLDDKKKGAIVIVMQRLHERDATGHLLQQGGYTHLKLPAVATERKVFVFLSGKEIVREKNDLLWQEREGEKEIAEARTRLGEYGFAGQYQQEPVPKEGGAFKRAWFKIVKVAPVVARRCRFWDVAATCGDGDFTVGTRLARTDDGNVYIEDVKRDQWSPGDGEKIILQTAKLDGIAIPIRMEEEPGSSGKKVIADYTIKLAGYDFKGIRSTGEKETRWNPLARQAEAGNVYLVEGPWNEQWLREMELVPRAVHDDQADSASGAFNEVALGPQPLVVKRIIGQ